MIHSSYAEITLMTMGTGIFLSAVLLSLVLLFNGTKDRWNWKRIALFSLVIPIALAGVIAVGFSAESWLDNRPKPQTAFLDIPLTSTKSDVKFIKGEPAKIEGEDSWIYSGESQYGAKNTPLILVRLRGEQVRFVLYTDTERQLLAPALLGFSIGSTYDDVVSALGVPSHTDASADGLSRMISYEKLNVFYSFTQRKVSALGIYRSKDGPMLFRKLATGIEKLSDAN